jgi:biotin carboxyl carrier protein
MANYRVQILDRIYDVSIEDDTLEVNGNPVSLDMHTLDGKGQHVLRQPNRNIEAHVNPTQAGKYEVQIDGNYLNAEVALGFRSNARSQQNGKEKLVSPMPGLIIDIFVEAGDQVKQGDTLVIQEAMKMQMKLRSPSDGIITGILASPGSQVDKGELLISLEPTLK